MRSFSDKPGIFGRIRSRPIRIAYLLDLNIDEAHSALDIARNHALGLWAGRYSPIIPVEHGVVSGRYWNWLLRFDPDFIYSFSPLTPSMRLKIYRDLDPAELVEAEKGADQLRTLRHAFSTIPLSSLSILQNLPTTPIVGAPHVRLFSTWMFESKPSSLIDTFGDGAQTFDRFPLPTEGLSVFENVTLCDQQKLNDAKFFRRPEGIFLHTVEEAWRHLLDNPMIGLPQLTALKSPRYELPERDISSYFQLIIGDTPSDRLLHWNIGHYLPCWREGTMSCLRLALSDLESEGIVSAVRSYFETQNRISQEGGGRSYVAVRSTSLTEEQLTQIAERFRSEKPRAFYRAYAPHGADEIVPNPRELELSQFDPPNMGFQLSGWDQFYWDGELALPPLSTPKHLTSYDRTERFNKGHWAVDIDLSRGVDLSKYANVRHVWRFSKRIRMAAAISISKKTSDILGRSPSDKRRISRYGLLTSFSSLDSPVSEVAVPSDSQLFRHALTQDIVHLPSQRSGPFIRAPFKHMRRSDKGDYVRGLLEFAGGIDAAISFLLHEFWVSQLDRWGASSKVSSEATKQVKERLVKKFGNSEKPISEHLDEVANTAVRYARSYRSPWQTIEYKVLARDWKEYRSKFWENAWSQGEVVGTQTEEDREDWERMEHSSLGSSIQNLVGQGVLFQGLTLSCSSCRHKNWITISELAHRLKCGVCQSEIAVPLELSWEFKLNDFILQCIRDHGVHSIVWALNICREKSRNSFFFLEPTEVWTGEDAVGAPDTDIDITAILDAKSYVIEVKSSASNFGVKAREDFSKIVARVSPDCAVIAIMENLTERQKGKILAETKELLANVSTHVELWSLDQYPFGQDPYL